MNIPIKNFGSGSGPDIRACCPSCKRDALFEKVGIPDLTASQYWLGLRRCPNSQCHSHLFFIDQNGEVIESHPAQRIDFETKDIPPQIVSHLNEAITCHAEKCYTAAAMMMRRTLEEICFDRGASGNDLKEKIKMLRNKIVIPQELFEGMDELRLLGNDAAHIESMEFSNVGKEEVEAGIEFTKEILKAVYQYSHLLKRLRELKIKTP